LKGNKVSNTSYYTFFFKSGDFIFVLKQEGELLQFEKQSETGRQLLEAIRNKEVDFI
jgi:hypothetical protein